MKNSLFSFFGQNQKRGCICDSDLQDTIDKERESDTIDTLHRQGIEKYDSTLVLNEMDRRSRAEELIKMGKSYRPLTTERCHDEPDLGRD
jgi:hypothetical protein